MIRLGFNGNIEVNLGGTVTVKGLSVTNIFILWWKHKTHDLQI